MDNAAQSSSTESHHRTIIHIDMDCYYAQVEEIRNPLLRGKPVGVQQKNIVVTSNYIAREYGIKKLISVPEALKLCPELVLVNGEDLTNYRQMSSKIFEVFHNFTPIVEKLGLDENFLDVTNIVSQRLGEISNKGLDIIGCIYPENGSLDSCECGCSERLAIGTHIAKEIRDELKKTLGLTSCAGISYNKLLAKLVGSLNKPNNQTVLVSTHTADFMRKLNSLQRVTGIGVKTESLLLENGIANITDLQNCNIELLKKKLGYESACKLKDLSFGCDTTSVRPSGKPKSIGLEDSCRPISVCKDVEKHFRILLLRLVDQASEDGRMPIAIKIILRKFDKNKKTSHRETKQANIMPSLFKQSNTGQIALAEGAQQKLLKIIMRLFERIVDTNKPFNITLLGLSFSKFQERKFGSSSIANFLIKKTDLEVQSVMSLTNDECFSPQTSSAGDDYYRRRATASPIPMLVDAESISSDHSDFSETEFEPSPKKTRLGMLIAKRRCLSNNDGNDIASPSKLRVAELRLNSRDSEKDLGIVPVNSTKPLIQNSNISENCDNNKILIDISTHTSCDEDDHNEISEEKISPATTITGNLTNIPCPSGVDPEVFKELPIDVRNELISSWRNSIAAKASSSSASHTNSTPGGGNTLYRYFIRNK